MQTNQNFPSEQVLKSLQDPVRRQLFDYVSRSARSVSREEAARAAGISRTLAAYHLDHLDSAGLLETAYARRDGKSGPGAGRPAKIYAAAQPEVVLSVPARNYRLLGSLLAAAAAADGTGAVRQALAEAARQEGQRAGAAHPELRVVLQRLGYEPQEDGHGTITMANCPFHVVAQEQRELVCQMNYQLLCGVLSGVRRSGQRATLAPEAGRCCAVIEPA